MSRPGLWLPLLLMTAMASAQTVVARDGQAKAAIVLSPGATAPERHAAAELAHWLGQITGATLPVRTGTDAPENAIVVGQGALARSLLPDQDWTHLGLEETIVKTVKGRTVVVGGRPRGTIYAAHRLLHKLGCRWWTPWASSIPKNPDLHLAFDFRERPAFESRDSFWYSAFDGDWAARNGVNGQTARLEEKHGGKILYAGFVHTFYPLVPPEKHFASHPEWYSLIDGKRTAQNAQLCTTDPILRDFIVAGVKKELAKNPKATIVSISQNDCYNPCQCSRCQTLAQAEGSEAAPVLALANYVAERIEKSHPQVAVDTLAYQYTRKAPKTIKPRPNVIVRLCSIECNFAQPLTHPSNASFAQDIRDWSRLTDRLYIWNYDTNFAHYPQPIPNYFVLGPNERFFRANGVRGVFEQGAYQSNGGEMAEMRAWVQAQLLWNPAQDDKALIDEFLRGYYGPAAPSIRAYLDLMADAAKDEVATIYDPPTKSFFSFEAMTKAEKLWQEAERVTKDEQRWRVRQGHLAILYVWLNRWNDFRAQARSKNVAWPLPTSRKAVAAEWLAVATGPGPAGWTPMTHVNEGGNPPAQWVARFATDPVDAPPLPGRATAVPWPKDFDPMGKTAVDLQDDLARLANDPEWATLRADPAASDGIAARMPGNHHEWAFQLPLKAAPARYRVLLVARVDRRAGEGPAFSAGVYDDGAKKEVVTRTFDTKSLALGYRTYDLGTFSLTPTCYLWVAPPALAEIESVWIDRVILVKE